MPFRFDRLALGLLAAAGLAVGGHGWLLAHPEANPWAPLALDHPPGWATARKFARLRREPAECPAVLARSGIGFTRLPPLGEGQCRREDRVVAAGAVPLAPAHAEATCAVQAGLVLWTRQAVQPAARDLLGSAVARIEHYGTHSCRRIGGGSAGAWSEHATGNAIDIAGFVLADGRRIVLARHWGDGGAQGAFLRRVRDRACGVFGTVLSPDYNRAHADHLHFDQAAGRLGWSVCR